MARLGRNRHRHYLPDKAGLIGIEPQPPAVVHVTFTVPFVGDIHDQTGVTENFDRGFAVEAALFVDEDRPRGADLQKDGALRGYPRKHRDSTLARTDRTGRGRGGEVKGSPSFGLGHHEGCDANANAQRHDENFPFHCLTSLPVASPAAVGLKPCFKTLMS